MCTVTLSYDKKNAKARDMLASGRSISDNQPENGEVNRMLLQKARGLTIKELDEMKHREFITPQELKLLLYRTVDDVYQMS